MQENIFGCVFLESLAIALRKITGGFLGGEPCFTRRLHAKAEEYAYAEIMRV